MKIQKVFVENHKNSFWVYYDAQGRKLGTMWSGHASLGDGSGNIELACLQIKTPAGRDLFFANFKKLANVTSTAKTQVGLFDVTLFEGIKGADCAYTSSFETAKACFIEASEAYVYTCPVCGHQYTQNALYTRKPIWFTNKSIIHVACSNCTQAILGDSFSSCTLSYDAERVAQELRVFCSSSVPYDIRVYFKEVAILKEFERYLPFKTLEW